MRIRLLIFLTATVALALPVAAAADDPVTELVPGTAVLLSSSSSGSGSTSSTSSKTTIFSPSTYSDYKRFGAEPTVVVDRYPFVPGPFGFGATTTEFRDLTYTSAPIGVGVPGFSLFWKSDDLARTFRVPPKTPIAGRLLGQGTGGGDSHQAIGQVTHKVFFVDLPLDCVTLNTSTDLGETFTPDQVGCGTIAGIDDRQWVDVDEKLPGVTTTCLTASPVPTCGNVYISFIAFTNAAAPTLALARSTHDGANATFATDSPCNYGTASAPPSAPDNVPTPCPDPSDSKLQIAGPVVADKEKTHNVYIPFLRSPSTIPLVAAGPPYELWVARSKDGGESWTRHRVAELGLHNPANIFPKLTVDRGGNLYYVWSQSQGPAQDESGLLGETDVYYAFSTNEGETWSQPIPLTQETGDSAVFPWAVAGDPGQVDLVFYKANTGVNPTLAFVDEDGNECEEGSPGCRPNPSVWNVFFSQSQNALNTGSNFKTVQISDHPMHVGQICTGGIGCTLGGNRGLLDFFTVDVDHLGAAVVSWADDNHGLAGIARAKVARQLSGNSVFKNQTITLKNTWGITDHAVIDRGGDTYDGFGNLRTPPCPGMDLLAASANRSDDRITVTLTLNGAPTATGAAACSSATATGGVWGAEFWAASTNGGNNFYVAYRDNAGDFPNPRVEGGDLLNINSTLTSLEFRPFTFGTLGGTCFTPAGVPTTVTPCTVSMTVSASSLGIKPGAGLYSITPVSTEFVGTSFFPLLGNSEHADAAVAFDYLGTGTTK